MARPKDSTPAGLKALKDGDGHKGMKGRNQLPRIAEKDLEKIDKFQRKVRGER